MRLKGPFGSIRALYVSYRKLIFPTLSASTQATRAGILERFCKEHGNDLVAQLRREHVAAIVAARAETPHAANNLRKVLRHLLGHAVDICMIAHNPVVGTKRIKTASNNGIHCWLDEEIARYRDHWPLGTQQRLCFELALGTTSRRGDVTRIGPQHERNGKLYLRHTKNNAHSVIPITAELRAAIDAMGRPNN